ncbi:MAG: hypothetical protein ACRELE_04160, partial [Gemmatimonadales bacterium]
GSGNTSDWITLDFGIPRPVVSVKLYFLDDSTGIRAPARYLLEMWQNGKWESIPGQQRSPDRPQGHRANTVTFPVIRTSKLRAVLVHRPGASSGLTEIEAWTHASLPLAVPTAPPSNFAWGARATASFTGRSDRIDEINDMTVAFSRYSRNRWTAFGTPNASDWVELDLPTRHRVTRLELYLWGDAGGVKAPRRYVIQTWNGEAWVDARVLSQIPLRPQVSSVNTVRIAPRETDRVRVIFQHALPAATGVTELMIWGDD